MLSKIFPSNGIKFTEDLCLAINAAKEAGEIIRKNYNNREKNVYVKGVNNFVTETDIKVESVIISSLSKTKYSIYSEESGKSDKGSSRQWVIDPLDGTTNFIRGIPFFCVSIGLIENNRDLLLGVIYDPIADEYYYAEKGKGAFKNNERIKVSNNNSFDNALILIEHGGSEGDKERFLESMRRLMMNNGAPVERQGGTALMLCYAARGSAEAFLSSGDKLYDYAAGLVIAKEAGAIVTDWKGHKWDNSNSFILVSNPCMHDKILKRIAGLQK